MKKMHECDPQKWGRGPGWINFRIMRCNPYKTLGLEQNRATTHGRLPESNLRLIKVLQEEQT